MIFLIRFGPAFRTQNSIREGIGSKRVTGRKDVVRKCAAKAPALAQIGQHDCQIINEILPATIAHTPRDGGAILVPPHAVGMPFISDGR